MYQSDNLTSSRYDKAENAYNRYFDNISKKKSYQNGNYTRRYVQNTYMGNSKG